MPVVISKLSIDTAGNLEHLAPEVFDCAIAPDHLGRFLADPRHIMFLAIEPTYASTGLVVGMASGVEYFHPDKAPQLWINEVGVTPSYRRRGIGRRLVEALIEEGWQRGCRYAWLGTARDNAEAQACFASISDGEAPEPFLLYAWDNEEN